MTGRKGGAVCGMGSTPHGTARHGGRGSLIERAKDKVVVLAFRDEATFRAWYDSEEYQSIAKDRIESSRGPVILARGFPRKRV